MDLCHLTPSCLLRQRWALVRAMMEKEGADFEKIAADFEKTNLSSAWGTWSFDAAGTWGIAPSSQAIESYHYSVKHHLRKRVSQARFVFSYMPALAKRCSVRFCSTITRKLSLALLPNDPKCVQKARSLLDHPGLWYANGNCTYFNSASVLGRDMLDTQVNRLLK